MFEFKEGVTVETDDFWYDLTEGRITPDAILSNKAQIAEVNKALKLLKEFRVSLEVCEIINYH